MDWKTDYNWLEVLGFAGYPKAESLRWPSLIEAGPASAVWRTPPRPDEGVAVALVEGENDEADWYGLFYGIHRAVDGAPMWTFVQAGCDYTGWDCQADGYSYVSRLWGRMVDWGLTDEAYATLDDHPDAVYLNGAENLQDAVEAAIELLGGSEDYDLVQYPHETRNAVSSPLEALPVIGVRPQQESIGRRRPVSVKAREQLGTDALRCLLGLRESFGAPETWGIKKVAGLWTLTDRDGEPMLCLPVKYAEQDNAVALLAGVVSGVATGLRLFDGELEGEDVPELRFS